METVNQKVSSLKWAIGELAKQREELESRLKIARKRDETSSLIKEVHDQKEALQKRIAALNDGLRVSSELVEKPVSEIEDDLSQVNEKLMIAEERLESLEQEEYFEELGKKLNRSHSETEIHDNPTREDSAEIPVLLESPTVEETPSNEKEPERTSPESPKNFPSTVKTISSTLSMKSTTNRIHSEKLGSLKNETSDPQSQDMEESSADQKQRDGETNTVVVSESLEKTAAQLGVEPDFLLNKGIQAILRMIARNGGKLRFPLEVSQID